MRFGMAEEALCLQCAPADAPAPDTAPHAPPWRIGHPNCCAEGSCRTGAAPRSADRYADWTLISTTPVSRQSAVCHLTSRDTSRGTPYTRGRGRTIWHKTWHTTLRACEESAGYETPTLHELDCSPISTWMDWDRGACDILVTWGAPAANWLLRQPPGRRVGLSQPKRTLAVPSLVPDPSKYSQWEQHDVLKHHGVLLLVLGGSGIAEVAQILQHAHPTTCFGAGATPVPPLKSPIHVIYACRRDDVLMADELAAWCAAEADGTRAPRLRRLVLALSAPHDQPDSAPFPVADAAPPGLGDLTALDNVSVVESFEYADNQPPLSSELLAAELAPLQALGGRCRVVACGPAGFAEAAAQKLADAGVETDAITVLPTA